MATAPVIVLIAKKGCPGCEMFAPDEQSKRAQGLPVNRQSQWEQVVQDPTIGSKYWSREFRTGIYTIEGIEYKFHIPDAFNYVLYVPRILVVKGPVYQTAFDLDTGAERSTSPIESIEYKGDMRADAIKKWLLEIYPQVA